MQARTSEARGGHRPLSIVARGAGIAIAAAIGITVVAGLLVWVARGMTEMPVSFGRSPIGVLGLVISPICYAAIGGILASRLPANPIGWLFLAIGAALGMMLPINLVVTAAHEALRPAPAAVVWLAWARTTFGTPVVLTAAVFAVLLFPDGHWPSKSWRWAGWLGAATGLLLLLTTAIDPVGLITYPSLANPLAAPYAYRGLVDGLRFVAVGGVALSGVLAVIAIRSRHGSADHIGRAQLRWIVVAAAVCVAAAIPFVVARYVLRVADDTGELLAAIAQIGACAFPLAAAMAISRYRLFDIDVLIGRTLVYLPLMAALGGMYTAGIALFQRVFVAVTGSESDAALVLTILVVAAAFTPLRRALEGAVDRRFAGLKRESPAPSPARPQRAELHAVAQSGTVDCPLGPSRTIRDCLGCARLIAISAEGTDVTVVCGSQLATP